MGRHTAGPWIVEGASRQSDVWVNAPTSGSGHVALIATRGASQEAHEVEVANAHLIASAPALLVALRAIIARVNGAK